jgi:hypothetical protein
MPKATSIATSQADFERLKPQGSQPPVKASWSQWSLLPSMLWFAGSNLIVSLCVTAYAGWCIAQDLSV